MDVDLPDRAVLFHNGVYCRLEMEIRGSGEDARIVMVIQPDKPPPASRRTFVEALQRLGVTFGTNQFGQAQARIAEMIWNERGRVDAEAFIDSVASQNMSSETIQNAIRHILLCDA